MSAKKVNFMLPSLPRFRLRSSRKQQTQPCAVVMASVLSCWASQGHAAQGCEAFEQALRVCMDTSVRFATLFVWSPSIKFNSIHNTALPPRSYIYPTSCIVIYGEVG
ncbi:37S ribosomal protein MRP10 [Drechslerella dactyloides]|uniref:37S ribosomal protein MRP10 n=1 Tax=Drechslerella dactyloides TaxID=74499 RepID=A0AAD6NK85_DREDA|nr:37S ribosomal protein MRP10 [Drechslerella dactyloides]